MSIPRSEAPASRPRPLETRVPYPVGASMMGCSAATPIQMAQAEQLTELVEQILLFSATDKARHRYHLQAVSVEKLIECALTNTASLIRASAVLNGGQVGWLDRPSETGTSVLRIVADRSVSTKRGLGNVIRRFPLSSSTSTLLSL